MCTYYPFGISASSKTPVILFCFVHRFIFCRRIGPSQKSTHIVMFACASVDIQARYNYYYALRVYCLRAPLQRHLSLSPYYHFSCSRARSPSTLIVNLILSAKLYLDSFTLHVSPTGRSPRHSLPEMSAERVSRCFQI